MTKRIQKTFCLSKLSLIMPLLLVGFTADFSYADNCLLDTSHNGSATVGSDTTLGASSGNVNTRIACGFDAEASGNESSIAIGAFATSSAVNTVVLGTNAVASGNFASSFGSFALAAGFGATAIGEGASSFGNNSVAFGRNSSADANNATAIGVAAKALGNSAIALGRAAQAGGDFSVSTGFLTEATGEGAVAYGTVAKASNVETTAIGHDAEALGENATALGSRAAAVADDSTAVGRLARAASIATIALGYRSGVSDDAFGGIAIGADSNGDGRGARALAPGAIAIGADVVANIPNTMVTNIPFLLKNDNGTAKITVEESGFSATRTLFELSNPGDTKFMVTNTDDNVSWAMVNSGKDFRLSRQGSGVVELKIQNNGNAILAGVLTQNSDVNAKHNIEAVNHRAILNKVVSLPISEWSYKDDGSNRHIGPMAQDFYQAFNLGDTNKGISSIDTGGVALVAIQGLYKEVQEKGSKVSQLKVENELLKSELEQLKAMVLSVMKNQQAMINVASLSDKH